MVRKESSLKSTKGIPARSVGALTYDFPDSGGLIVTITAMTFLAFSLELHAEWFAIGEEDSSPVKH